MENTIFLIEESSESVGLASTGGTCIEIPGPLRFTDTTAWSKTH